MKPLQHALIAAHRYGGTGRDWIGIHASFDVSKSHFASMQHRALLHSDYGCALVQRLFGPTVSASDGTTGPD
jgi:hypothetical protein